MEIAHFLDVYRLQNHESVNDVQKRQDLCELCIYISISFISGSHFFKSNSAFIIIE